LPCCVRQASSERFLLPGEGSPVSGTRG
jgi:hypothetical protein